MYPAYLIFQSWWEIHYYIRGAAVFNVKFSFIRRDSLDNEDTAVEYASDPVPFSSFWEFFHSS